MTDYREGSPAINVRDRENYNDIRPLMDELGEARCQALYEMTQGNFWDEWAPEVAQRYGYGAVYAAGRSSGWLIVEKPPEDVESEGEWVALVDGERVVCFGHESYEDAMSEARWHADEGEEPTARYETNEAREQWERFEREIESLVGFAQEHFRDWVREDVEELHARQAAALVRGEN